MSLNQRTILLVEDNPNDEALTLRALKKSNISNHIDIARDGAEALDYLFSRGAYVDRVSKEIPYVVLLDLNLPKLSGIEVLKHIRAEEKLKSLPVVILTSSKQDRDLVDTYGLGANSYVVKPVDFEQFTEVVKQLALYWIQVNECVARSEQKSGAQ